MKKIVAGLLLTLLLLFSHPVFSCDVNLSWTAPGDDGMLGFVSQYDIRFSSTLITDETWDQSSRAEFTDFILPAGSRQNITVEGLEGGKTYFFALKSCDESNNWAPISNVVPKVAGIDNCDGLTGNINCDVDEVVNVEDIIILIDYLFKFGGLPCCVGEANLYNLDSRINIMDLTILIQYYFYSSTYLRNCSQ